MTVQRPRIAVVGRYYNKQGGVSNVMAQLAERIARLGIFDISVFSAEFLDVDRSAGVRMVEVPMTRGPSWLEVPSFARHARRLVDAGRFDLVHVHDPQMKGGDLYTAHSCFADYIGTQRREASATKGLASRAFPPHAGALHREHAAYSRGNPTIVAVSRSVAEAVNATYAPTRPATHVYNGIDLTRFRTVSRENSRTWLAERLGEDISDSFNIVFVGYEFDRKRLGVAIEVVARLKGRARLIVAGKGPVDRYARLAEERGARQWVHFLGHLPHPEFLLRAGDTFLFPTKYEAASLAILEALAAGIPVVTTNVAMAGEVLVDGLSGVLLPNSDDPIAATSAVERLMSDPSLRRRMAQAGSEVADRFSWDQIAKRYAEVYLDQLSGRTLQ